MFLRYVYRPHYQWNPLLGEFDYRLVLVLHSRRTEFDEWQPVQQDAFPSIEDQNILFDRYPPPEPPSNSRPMPL